MNHRPPVELPGSEPQGLPPSSRLLLVGLFVLGLILVIGLGLALQSVARTSIVMPLLYLAWLADLMFRSVPGWLWWAWFLIIALVIAGRSLRVRTRPEPSERRDFHFTTGAVRSWMGRIEASEHGEYFRWRLARDLAELALQLLAYRNRGEVAPRDRSQSIELLEAPAPIAEYLRSGLTAPPWQPHDLRSRLAQLRHPTRNPSPLSVEPATIARFLEGQLEKEHDS